MIKNTAVPKKLIFFACAAVLILGVSLIDLWAKKQNSSYIPELLFEDLKLDDIQSLEYKGNDMVLVFSKNNDKWEINNKAASTRIVEITISKLLQININSIVTFDANTYSNYLVEDSSSYLIISTNTSSTKVLVGKVNSDGGNFIRFFNTINVLGTDTSISSIFDNEDFFVDKTITRIDPNSITEFTVNENKYKLVYSVWFKNSKTVELEQLKNILYYLSNIEGISIASEKTVSSLLSTTPVLQVSINNESRFEFYTLGGNYYVHNQDSQYYFQVLDSVYQQIITEDSIL